MNPLRIDFAPRSLGREIALMSPLSWLSAAIGLALCVAGFVAVGDMLQQQGARQAEVKQLQSQIAARTAPVASTRKSATSATSAASAISEAQASAVNSAIQQLNVPWSRLLDAIELATPATVALLELAPDAKRNLVKGVAETKSTAAMIDYIGRLKQQPFFGNVVLTRHVINQESDRSIRFEFEAEWGQAGS